MPPRRKPANETYPGPPADSPFHGTHYNDRSGRGQYYPPPRDHPQASHLENLAPHEWMCCRCGTLRPNINNQRCQYTLSNGNPCLHFYCMKPKDRINDGAPDRSCQGLTIQWQDGRRRQEQAGYYEPRRR